MCFGTFGVLADRCGESNAIDPIADVKLIIGRSFAVTLANRFAHDVRDRSLSMAMDTGLATALWGLVGLTGLGTSIVVLSLDTLCRLLIDLWNENHEISNSLHE